MQRFCPVIQFWYCFIIIVDRWLKCLLSLKEIIKSSKKNVQKRSRFAQNLHWNVILRNRLAVIVYYTVFHYFPTKTTDLHHIDRYYRYYFSRIYPSSIVPIKIKEDVCIYNVYTYTYTISMSLETAETR